MTSDVIATWTGRHADALRQALRMTIEAFAGELHVAARTAAEWRARSDIVPIPAVQEALDAALALAPESAKTRFRLILAERERRGAGSQPSLAGVSEWIGDDQPPGDAQPGSLWPSGEERILAVPAAGARLVTSGDLSRVRGMRAHLKAIDNAHGGGAALAMATAYLRNEILPLLNERDHGPAMRNLNEATAEYEHDVGWMAYDAGRQDVASKYFDSALRRARAAGNRLLAGRILAAMSHQAIHLGRLRQGIELAQASREVTAQAATPRAIAMEAAMEACAHAAAGDARHCHRALDDAADAVSRATAADQRDPEWLDFDEGGFWGHAARAYRDLGEPRKAEEAAQKAVRLCLPGHRRTRAQRNTILATAHLRMGDVEAAAAAGQQVVSEAWNLHSGHVFGEVVQLSNAIAAFRTHQASDFLDQAHELLAARQPPGADPRS
jgi:tetratricopeptide (TPR) repeat protein